MEINEILKLLFLFFSVLKTPEKGGNFGKYLENINLLPMQKLLHFFFWVFFGFVLVAKSGGGQKEAIDNKFAEDTWPEGERGSRRKFPLAR